MGIETRFVLLKCMEFVQTQPTRYMGIETKNILFHLVNTLDTTYSLYGY